MMLFAFAACGGSTTTSTSTASIAGSYDVTFSSVAISNTGGFWTNPGTPALEGGKARLDIQQTSSGYSAQLAPEWGDAQTFAVTITNDAITLTGEASYTTGSNYGSISDRVESIRLARSGNGLSGSGMVSGHENVFEGDVGGQADLAAKIALAKDTTVPRVRDESPTSAGTAHLPWDRVVVQTSEPLDADGVRARTTLAGKALASGGFATDWSALAGAKLRVAGGLSDPSGNTSADYEVAWNVADIGKPVASATLDKGTWGKFSTVTTPCESGSCLEIGPTETSCDSIGSGVAARIATQGKTEIVIRYRLRAKPMYGMPNQESLRVSIARPGEGAKTTQFHPTMVKTNDPDFSYASNWGTAIVSVPQADEIGVAVSVASDYSFCGGPSVAPDPYVADIQSITAQ